MALKRQKLNFEVFSMGLSTGVAYKNRALKKQIIQIIDAKSSSSITELGKDLNISIPKTTALVNELISDGLLQDEGKVDSTGGRRASVYGMVPDACFFLGVDVKKYHINIGLMNFRKRIIHNKERLPFKLENTAESLKNLLSLIKEFLSHSQVDRKSILGCGINLSGIIIEPDTALAFIISGRNHWQRLLNKRSKYLPISKMIREQWLLGSCIQVKYPMKKMYYS
jgi:hypothetical protein